MARVFTTGWELGHTGSSSSGTIHEADVTARLIGNIDTTDNPARGGGRALRVIAGSSLYLHAGIDVPATDEFWLRWGFLYTSTGIRVNTNTILSWAGAAGVVGGLRFKGDTLAMSLWSGSDAINSGSTETELASEPGGVLKPNRWHLFELHWRTGASGAAELRVDGAQVITFAGDTDDGKGQVTQIRFGYVIDDFLLPGGARLYYDDCAMDDADWIGDGHVALLRPDGNGNSSQLVGSDGDQADNFLLVNETPAENSDYVEGDAPGMRDTYALEDTSVIDIPANAEIKHVDVLALGRTLSVGTDGLKGVVRTGGSDHLSPSQTLKSAFAPHRFGFPLNPDTGQPWTLGELDDAEAGIETA